MAFRDCAMLEICIQLSDRILDVLAEEANVTDQDEEHVMVEEQPVKEVFIPKAFAVVLPTDFYKLKTERDLDVSGCLGGWVIHRIRCLKGGASLQKFAV